MLPDQAADSCVAWEGELLWPCPLADAAVIDLSAVSALGSWAHEWFRQRPQQAVIGASVTLKRQLQMAKLPILWHHSRRLAVPGQIQRPLVNSDERALLWGEDDG